MFPSDFVWENPVLPDFLNGIPAPVFRKSFTLSAEDLQAAECVLCSTGFYELFLNGQRITRGELVPSIYNPDDVLFYDRYDLTPFLKKGENVLGVLLGSGFQNAIGGDIWHHKDRRCAPPALALQVTCGSVTFTAPDMLCRPSALLFNDYRCGTLFDARLIDLAWCTPEASTDGWHAPLTADVPAGEPRFVTCEPVREIRRLRAGRVEPGELREYRIRDSLAHLLYGGDTVMGRTPLSGGYIYDFGENIAGVPVLHIKGTPGQRIEMQFSELLFEGFVDYTNVDVYPDGCCQRDVYICRGEGEETWRPPFTYHGARYCYVYGITPEQATPDLLEFAVLHNDVPRRAVFSCSDPLTQQIYDACIRSEESNLFYVLTDCPAREKNGWTGDAAISAEHYLMNWGTERCFADWLACLRRAQHENGIIPEMVPSANIPTNTPIWDSIITFFPYEVYRHTGDLAVITDNLPAIRRNIAYYRSIRDERGVVECGYGDWIPVDSPIDAYASPLGFCCTAILSEECRMAAVMARAVGDTAAAEEFEGWRAEFREALLAEYDEGGVITAGRTERYHRATYRPCQTSQAVGLALGLFPEAERPAAFRKLVELIHENGDAFDCGFLGLRYLFRVLAENGEAELAYRLITRPQHPSYANMILRGETTVWERFLAPGERIGSHNHHFLADLAAWYLRTVTGLRPNPDDDDPERVDVAPVFLAAIDRAEGHYCTPGGRVQVAWAREAGRVRLTVTVSGSARVTVVPQPENVDVTVVNA